MPQEVPGATQRNSGIVGRVRESATAQLSSQKDRATDGLGSVAQAVRQTTQQLRDQHHETIADYVEQAAIQLDQFSQRLREKDVNEIVNDVQQLARRHPSAFIGSAFALGLVGARFLKSSRQDQSRVGRVDRGLDYGRNSYGADTYRRGEYGSNQTSRQEYGGVTGSTGSASNVSASTYGEDVDRLADTNRTATGASSLEDSAFQDSSSLSGGSDSSAKAGASSRRRGPQTGRP